MKLCLLLFVGFAAVEAAPHFFERAHSHARAWKAENQGWEEGDLASRPANGAVEGGDADMDDYYNYGDEENEEPEVEGEDKEGKGKDMEPVDKEDGQSEVEKEREEKPNSNKEGRNENEDKLKETEDGQIEKSNELTETNQKEENNKKGNKDDRKTKVDDAKNKESESEDPNMKEVLEERRPELNKDNNNEGIEDKDSTEKNVEPEDDYNYDNNEKEENEDEFGGYPQNAEKNEEEELRQKTTKAKEIPQNAETNEAEDEEEEEEDDDYYNENDTGEPEEYPEEEEPLDVISAEICEVQDDQGHILYRRQSRVSLAFQATVQSRSGRYIHLMFCDEARQTWEYGRFMHLYDRACKIEVMKQENKTSDGKVFTGKPLVNMTRECPFGVNCSRFVDCASRFTNESSTVVNFYGCNIKKVPDLDVFSNTCLVSADGHVLEHHLECPKGLTCGLPPGYQNFLIRDQGQDYEVRFCVPQPYDAYEDDLRQHIAEQEKRQPWEEDPVDEDEEGEEEEDPEYYDDEDEGGDQKENAEMNDASQKTKKNKVKAPAGTSKKKSINQKSNSTKINENSWAYWDNSQCLRIPDEIEV